MPHDDLDLDASEDSSTDRTDAGKLAAIAYDAPAVFEGYALGMRRVFWGLAIVFPAALFVLITASMKGDFQQAWWFKALGFAAAAAAISGLCLNLWGKSSLCEFELPFSANWLVRGTYYCDLGGILVRFVRRNFPAIAPYSTLISAALVAVGTWMFFKFLQALAELMLRDDLRGTAKRSARAIVICASLFVPLLATFLKFPLPRQVFLAWGFIAIMSGVVAFAGYLVLLWQMPIALREYAADVRHAMWRFPDSEPAATQDEDESP